MSKSQGSGSDTVTYEFECDGTPCTSRTIEIAHLSFEKVADFTDVTSVAFQGIVSIGGTKDEAGDSCPLEGVKVCAINHYGTNEQLVCRETNFNGELA